MDDKEHQFEQSPVINSVNSFYCCFFSNGTSLLRKALSLDQIRKLLSVLPDQRLKLIVLLAVYAGLRRKEISRLFWGDFVFDPVFSGGRYPFFSFQKW